MAGHTFGVSGGAEVFALMDNYEPFLTSQAVGDPVFMLAIADGQAVSYVEDLRQEEEGQQIVCGRTADLEPVYEFIWWNVSAGWLVCTDDYREGRLILTGHHTKMAINNAVMVSHALGNECPKVAALAAVEKVNEKMPCTVEAAKLAEMNRAGEIEGCIVDGPLQFDNVVSEEAAKHKGIESPVAGAADVLLVPDIEAGNMLVKAAEFFGHAKKAGVIVGAKAPIALTSRASSAESKLYTIAIARLIARHMAA